jgi:hypothetical protein
LKFLHYIHPTDIICKWNNNAEWKLFAVTLQYFTADVCDYLLIIISLCNPILLTIHKRSRICIVSISSESSMFEWNLSTSGFIFASCSVIRCQNWEWIEKASYQASNSLSQIVSYILNAEKWKYTSFSYVLKCYIIFPTFGTVSLMVKSIARVRHTNGSKGGSYLPK